MEENKIIRIESKRIETKKEFKEEDNRVKKLIGIKEDDTEIVIPLEGQVY